MDRFKNSSWNDEEELIKDIEENSDYDVLGVFEDYINVIDRTGWDGKEVSIDLIRLFDGRLQIRV